MSSVGVTAGWGLLIAASLLAGALGAAALRLPERVAATLTAFGGGLLLAAIALELVPEADRQAGPALTAAGIVAGTLVYVAADAWLSRDATMRSMRRARHAAAAGRAGQMPVDLAAVARGESIAVGLVVDGIPESVALGLTIAEGDVGLALLAGVVVGNVVEAYGSAQPIIAGGRSKRFAVRLLGVIGLALGFATILGATLLSGAPAELVGASQAFAAGAVLAVISIAVIPHAFMEVSTLVASATVAGFVGGYLLT